MQHDQKPVYVITSLPESRRNPPRSDFPAVSSSFFLKKNVTLSRVFFFFPPFFFYRAICRRYSPLNLAYRKESIISEQPKKENFLLPVSGLFPAFAGARLRGGEYKTGREKTSSRAAAYKEKRKGFSSFISEIKADILLRHPCRSFRQPFFSPGLLA